MKNPVKLGVIGAESVVTKDVPEYTVVVGNLGRVMGYRTVRSGEV